MMIFNRLLTLLSCVLVMFSLAACGGGGGGGEGGSATDTTPPVVSRIFPADGSTTLFTNVLVGVTFDEANSMNETSIQNGFGVFAGNIGDTSNEVAGTISYDTASKTATFTSDILYTAEGDYWFGVHNSVADAAGNPIGTDEGWSFTVDALAGDVAIAPTVTAVTPLADTINVVTTSQITMTFDTEMYGVGFNAQTAQLVDITDLSAIEYLEVLYSYDDTTNTLTMTPTQPLASSHDYNVKVGHTVRSAGGIPMGTIVTDDFSSLFTTAASAPPPPPG